ncbi:MAG: PQQ-binding-like beta-propeller repeat protein [Proteobacteria bacterium]|nr:PQQ-binding-like beta-propeller repeat protein [Pseudomonadota bacterium]
MAFRHIFVLCYIASAAAFGQDDRESDAVLNTPRPGIASVQIPFAALHPQASWKIGGELAYWVLPTPEAVWVVSAKPYAVRRIDPKTAKVVATIALPGEVCSKPEFAFGTLWVPVCSKMPVLLRIDPRTNQIGGKVSVGWIAPDGDLTSSADSLWMVTGNDGTLSRINPDTGAVRQRVHVPRGSFNPLYSDGVVWITSADKSVLTAIDASSGEVLGSVPVGLKPRFLTAGGGSIWTLNQGDGSVSRIDAKSRKVIATIAAGLQGEGGEICYGANTIWATVFTLPLTRIDPSTNKTVRQWKGPGGDSLGCDADAVWLMDYIRGTVWRLPYPSVAKP